MALPGVKGFRNSMRLVPVLLRPRLHGAGQVFIRTSFCTNNLRLHGTRQIFVRFAFPFTQCLIGTYFCAHDMRNKEQIICRFLSLDILKFSLHSSGTTTSITRLLRHALVLRSRSFPKMRSFQACSSFLQFQRLLQW